MVFHRAHPWRARRPAFGSRSGSRVRGTATPIVITLTDTDTALDFAPPPTHATISVLGVRRRYWEITHGWRVPANATDAPVIETPGRVA
ncbi:MAG: hypothetical protein QM692_03575 [Thermomicrobiales bacterium]